MLHSFHALKIPDLIKKAEIAIIQSCNCTKNNSISFSGKEILQIYKDYLNTFTNCPSHQHAKQIDPHE